MGFSVLRTYPVGGGSHLILAHILGDEGAVDAERLAAGAIEAHRTDGRRLVRAVHRFRREQTEVLPVGLHGNRDWDFVTGLDVNRMPWHIPRRADGHRPAESGTHRIQTTTSAMGGALAITELNGAVQTDVIGFRIARDNHCIQPPNKW